MDLEKQAIQRIKTASEMSFAHYGLPLVLADSGGKDSAVCRELLMRSGEPFEVIHNLTTADAPQTIYYVRDRFRKLEDMGISCTVGRPVYQGLPTTMWQLIPQKKIPPTRTARYCCEVLKENGGNIMMTTGGCLSHAGHTASMYVILSLTGEIRIFGNISAQNIYL